MTGISAPLEDLEEVVEACSGCWEALRDARIFITGGTGFVGRWLVSSLLHADRRLGIGLSLVILSRDPDAFSKALPGVVGDDRVTMVAGDVRSFAYTAEPCTHVIHGASHPNDASVSPVETLETIVEGTRRVLAFAVSTGARRCLLVGSGAVYGTQVSDLGSFREDEAWPSERFDANSAYAMGKRMAEELCTHFANERGLQQIAIARCFAFLGPWLPMDRQFAAGNFIAHALRRQPIIVAGDGTAVRSYMYAADLSIWLITVLIRGQHLRAYNIGSPDPITIGELARTIAKSVEPELQVMIRNAPIAGAVAHRYLPDTSRAERELGLTIRVPFTAAIRRTLSWHEKQLARTTR